MLGLLFLFSSVFFGHFLFLLFFQKKVSDGITRFISGIFIGSFFAVWLVFFLSFLFPLYISTLLCSVFLILGGGFIWRQKQTQLKGTYSFFSSVLFFLLLLFSSYIMHQTLQYHNQTFLIGQDIWADSEVHIPLIRSFSLGENIPPTAPFVPNKNLSYHFMFYFWSGILENGGLPLVFNLNLLSIFSFAGFCYLVFFFFSSFFSSRFVGSISILLILFPSTFGLIDALTKLPPTSFLNFLSSLWNQNAYYSVHPFQSDYVSIFWGLVTYVNQRHLSFALVGLFLSLFLLYQSSHHSKREIFFLALITGGLPFWQIHVFIAMGGCIGVFLLWKKEYQKFFLFTLVSGLLSFPQLIFLSKDVFSSFHFYPGLFSGSPLSYEFFLYWVCNLGFLYILFPLSLFFVHKKHCVLLLSFTLLFLLAHLFQFNAELYNNHKFLNIWILGINAYGAFTLRLLWDFSLGKILVFPILFFLFLSGFGEFMVIKNQPTLSLLDVSQSSFTNWVEKNTPPQSVFLAPFDEMYHPVRLAGRKTYQHYPRYAWAYGYDDIKMNHIVKDLYKTIDMTTTKQILSDLKISYVILPKETILELEEINKSLYLDSFPLVYSDLRFDVVEIK